MKVFGTELTMVTAIGWVLVLHAANHLWAVQSVERATGSTKAVMLVALVVAAGAFLVAGLALAGRIALGPTVVAALSVGGGLLSVLLIALGRDAALTMGHVANALFVAAAIVVPRLAIVAVR